MTLSHLITAYFKHTGRQEFRETRVPSIHEMRGDLSGYWAEAKARGETPERQGRGAWRIALSTAKTLSQAYDLFRLYLLQVHFEMGQRREKDINNLAPSSEDAHTARARQI